MGKKFTRQELMQHLSYAPETGDFMWLKSGKGRSLLAPAGCSLSNGYVRINFNGGKHQAHRLAWFYMTGKWPDRMIDHINGDKLDNRWENLRQVERSTNGQNRRRANKNSASGLLGAHKCNSGPAWRSTIKTPGGAKFLGFFETAIDAHNAYISAKRKEHVGCTI